MRVRSIVTAGLLATAGAVVASRYTRAVRRHRARVRTGSQLLPSRFGQVEFATAGAGPPVLVSHGAGGGFDQALAIAAPLVAAGYRVIAPSRFGYLRSSSPDDPSPANQADAFAELLDALHVERAAVVGVSAGALSAVQLAVRHPDRCQSLVVVVPAASITPTTAQGPLPEQPWFSRVILDRVTRSDLLYWLGATFARDVMIRTVLGTDPRLVTSASAADRQRVDEVLWSVLPISERTRGLANDTRYASTPQAIAVGQITAPTLVVSLEDDLYRTRDAASFIAANTPGARLQMYRSGGHLWVGHDAELFADMIAFLRAGRTGLLERQRS